MLRRQWLCDISPTDPWLTIEIFDSVKMIMTTEEQFSPWYLAQLKPNCLRLATRNLGRQGFRTFCPLEHHTQRRKERFETSFRPLFPGYLFVQFDPMTTAWRAISHTHGVSRLVTFESHRPAEIPQALVSDLMNRCDETGRLRPPAVLKAGDRVQINAGPFADFIATVESLHPDRRVWVLLDLLGRPTRVALDPSDVRIA